MTDEQDYSHEPVDDLDTLAADMFREAIEANLAEEDNLQQVHEAFNGLVDAAVGGGGIVITGRRVKRLVRDHLWTQVNARAGRATYTRLKELASGQLPAFEVDALLDTAVTAGQNRRTLIRHLATSDVDRMLAEREANLAKQEAATADFRHVAATLVGWLAAHQTIPAAIAAGVVEFDDPDAGVA